MASKVLLELKVDDKGSLKIVEKEAKSAASATDRLSKKTKDLEKARSRYHKQEKGVGQAGLSSAKSFSKLNQTIGSGSSGLVGAYAVLAANVFAATAAFGVFQRAAQFDDLIKGLNFVGNAAGRNLPEVTKRLKEITNSAISTESAMRATALATGAGFSVEQLEGLTKIAKGASIALGRDLTDALDRLVRGTAKLEPEILDELGIMVRLDTAVQNYASQLGKSADALTDFERRQAFLNETLTQGEKKYFDIAEAIDTNPYDKLAASLSNLQKALIGFANNTLGIATAINFLANNVSSLAVVATALGGTLIRSIAPGLYNMEAAAAASADAFAAQRLEMLDNMETVGRMPKKYQTAVKAIKEGASGAAVFAAATTSLANSDKAYGGLIGKQNVILNKRTKSVERLTKVSTSLGKQQDALNNISEAANTGTLKQIQTAVSSGKAQKFRSKATRELFESLENADQATARSIVNGKQFAAVQTEIASGIEKIGVRQAGSAAAAQEAKDSITDYTNQVDLNAQRTTELNEIQQAQTKSTYKHARASAIANAASGSLKEAFTDLKTSIVNDSRETEENNKGKNKATKIFGKLGVASRTLGGSLKVLGSMFLRFLPYIGLIVTAGTILFSFIKDKFFPEDIVKKRIDEATKSFSSFKDIQDQFQETAADRAGALGNAYIAYAGVLDQIKSKLADITRFSLVSTNAEITSVTASISKAQARLKALREERAQARVGGGGATGGRMGRNASGSQVEIRNTISEINTLTEQRIDLEEKLITRQREGFNAVMDGAQAELEARIATAAVMKDSEGKRVIDPFGVQMAQRDLAKMEEIQTNMNLSIEFAAETAELTGQTTKQVAQEAINNANRQMMILNNTAGNISAAFKGIETSVAEANKVINKQQAATKEPFEDIQNSVKGVASNFAFVNSEIERLEAIKNPTTDQQADLREYEGILAALEVQIADLNIAEEFKKGADGLKAFDDEIERFKTKTKELRAEIAVMASENKEFAAAAKTVAGTESLVIANNNDLLQKKIDLLDEEIGQQKKLLGTQKEDTVALSKLEAERKKLNSEIVGEVELAAKARRAEITATKALQELEAARLETARKTATLMATIGSAGGQISPEKQFELDVLSSNAKIQAAEAELESAKLRLEIERAILEARFKDKDSQDGTNLSENEEKVLKLLDSQMSRTIAIGKEKVKQAKIDRMQQIASASAGTTGFNVDNLPPVTAAIIKGQDQVSKALAVQEQAEKDFEDLRKKRNAQAAKYEALSDEGEITYDPKAAQVAKEALAQTDFLLQKQNELKNNANQNFKFAQQAFVVSTLQGTAEAFRAMGPEGELGAAVVSASATLLGGINTSLQIIDDVESTAAEKTQARIAMVSAAISTISQITAAASAAKIASIDKEIEAEKKRDGQSAKSVERIKALEKKKESAQRKAFDMNKKMQMAQVVMNTAMAISAATAAAAQTAAAAGPAAPVVFGLTLGMLKGIIVAMGAAQLALIASTSFQGGGSGIGSGGGPTSISMGARSSGVDVGRSRSARGELAYFRGESGTGGPENFKPAFYGSRMRAAGGETTGYMVGEQGPELFVPDRPGTVVSNDDVADTIATPVNATFNINTIDASGVEDILVAQRGNIIGMIREGANSYGQGFLEEVDTSIYTPSAGGVSRY